MLTSVVLLVGRDSLLQLWFACGTGLCFLVLYLGLSPYRDESPSRIQLAALVQLEITYMTAALFYDREPKDLQGEALIVANCAVVLVLLVVALRGIGKLGECHMHAHSRVCTHWCDCVYTMHTMQVSSFATCSSRSLTTSPSYSCRCSVIASQCTCTSPTLGATHKTR